MDTLHSAIDEAFDRLTPDEQARVVEKLGGFIDQVDPMMVLARAHIRWGRSPRLVVEIQVEDDRTGENRLEERSLSLWDLAKLFVGRHEFLG